MSHTAANIVYALQKMLFEFGLDVDTVDLCLAVHCTTDSAANMLKAMTDSNLEGIRCVCHNATTALKCGLKRTFEKCERIQNMIISCKAVVRLLKKTYDASKFDTKLKAIAPTRFASLHDMLVSIDKNLDDICM